MLPQVIEQTFDVIRHGNFEHPVAAFGAIMVAAGGTFLDLRKQHAEDTIAAKDQRYGLQIADPDLLPQNLGNRTRRIERIGAYAAIIGASATLMAVASPFTRHSKLNGSASIVLDGSYAGDPTD